MAGVDEIIREEEGCPLAGDPLSGEPPPTQQAPRPTRKQTKKAALGARLFQSLSPLWWGYGEAGDPWL
jgi:hypothetical protein